MTSLAPETIVSLGSFPITNSFIDTLLVDCVVIGIVIYIQKRISVVPSFFQTLIELAVEQFYSLTESTAGQHTKKIFPFVMSFFLFILISNYSELIPIITSVGVYQHNQLVPL